MGDQTIQCRDCLGQIPLGAIRCSHCGIAQQRWWETSQARTIGLVLLAGVALVLLRLEAWHALGL